MKNSIKIIARAIIEKDRKILVCKNIKKNKNYYFLPGGHVEMEETSDKALVRELKEELNLSVKDVSFVGVIENIYREGRKNYNEINLIFNVRAINIEDKSCEDHLDFFFFDKRQFVKEIILPKILKEAVIKWQKDRQIFYKSNIEV